MQGTDSIVWYSTFQISGIDITYMLYSSFLALFVQCYFGIDTAVITGMLEMAVICPGGLLTYVRLTSSSTTTYRQPIALALLTCQHGPVLSDNPVHYVLIVAF